MSKDVSACTREFRRIYYHFSKALPNAGAKCMNAFRQCGRWQPACTQQKDDNITTIMKKKWIGISCNSGFCRPVGRHPWTIRKIVLATSQACLPITNNKTLPQEIDEYCTCNSMTPAHRGAMRCYSRLQSANVILSERRW